VLSIVCGYLTAQYVVEPVVNYTPQILSGDEADGDTEESDDTTEKQVEGYALQFGCYTSEDSADKVMETMSSDNGYPDGLQMLFQDNVYKIIGEIYETEAEARKALDELSEDIKAFVTTIYKEVEET
jgi:hypothetical protein